MVLNVVNQKFFFNFMWETATGLPKLPFKVLSELARNIPFLPVDITARFASPSHMVIKRSIRIKFLKLLLPWRFEIFYKVCSLHGLLLSLANSIACRFLVLNSHCSNCDRHRKVIFWRLKIIFFCLPQAGLWRNHWFCFVCYLN